MSYILVWKGSSAVLVEKTRNPKQKGKYIEKYIGSLGAITYTEMDMYRSMLKTIPQEQRVHYCSTRWGFADKKDITKNKYSDIPFKSVHKRTTTPETKFKAKPKPKKVKKEVIKDYPKTPHTKRMMQRTKEKRAIEKEKRERKEREIKDIPIPASITSTRDKKTFLNNLKRNYKEDIKESKETIRQEEIRMPPSLYAQRKEKSVINRSKAEIKAAENMIKRIEKHEAKL